MRRLLLGASLVPMCLLGLAMGMPAQARAIAVPVPYFQTPTKVAQSDLVITGQVMAIEDQDIKATIAPNSTQTMVYRIAVIQVKEALKGKVQNNIVRVGFPAPAANNNPAGGGVGGAVQPGQLPLNRPVPLPFPGKGGFGGPGQPLTIGQDGLFYLKQHHEGKFYTLPAYYSFVTSQNNAAFENEVTQVRNLTKVLANAPAALKSNNPGERIEAAALLLKAYRTQQGPAKTEAVDAEESKLLLKALLDADWAVNPKGGNLQNHPAILFNSLGLNQQNGGFQANLQQGVLAPAYIQSAKDWLEKNWQTYRIQKFVPITGNVGGPSTGVIGPIIGQAVPPIGPVQGGPLVPPGQPVPVPQPIPVPQPLPVPGGVQLQPAPVQGGIQIQPLPLEKK